MSFSQIIISVNVSEWLSIRLLTFDFDTYRTPDTTWIRHVVD